MKVLPLIVIYIILLTPFLGAQTTTALQAQLMDQQSKRALSYVSIGIIGTSIGTVSAPDGSFSLHLPDGINEDHIVRFSYIGYESKELTIASLHLLKDSIILLAQTPITLAAIEVRPLGNTSKIIGHKKTQTQRVTNFAISKKPNQNLGAAIGRKFKLGKQNTFLKTFQFFVAANNFDTVRFSVNLYATVNGKPDKLLHAQEIIKELQQQENGWIRVDLSPYNIYASGTIIAAITWIYHSPKGKYLQLPLTFPAIGATHYYRYGSQNKWKRFRGMSTAMQLEINY